ncbi:MAG TPA: DUF4340 domain-containing protein, partial [Clostridia bacterium]|nr:DUF4340 domain-containing protein [Clostridia bacterium]
MKIYKTAIIVIVILAVALAGFFIVREIVIRNTPSKTYELNAVITSVRSSTVNELVIDNDGIILNLKKASDTVYDSDGTKRVVEAWYLVGEEETALAQNIIDSLVISASNLVAREVIGTETEDLAQYGLDSGYSVAVKTEEGIEFKILLGNMLYNRDGYYAKLADDDTIYSIALYSANELYTTRGEILDLNIFKGTLSDVTAFSLVKKEEPVFTIQSESVITWVMTQPVEARADVTNSDEMIDSLLSLAVEEYIDVAPEDLQLYGLDKPSYTISITIDGEVQTMHIGRENIIDNTFYAMMEGKNEVFTIDSTTLTFLDNDAIDMVYGYPFIPAITNIKSVDIDIAGMQMLLEMEFDPEINMLSYKFDGVEINMVAGIQTWGSFFFQSMISSPVVELEPGWEITGEPYARLIFTYTDDAYEIIEYYERDGETCYFVRNGYYSGLVTDRAYISEDRGFAALV